MNKAIFIGNLFQFSPLREGRRSIPEEDAETLLFQFTPLREGRRAEHDGVRHRQHFNSRPSARGDFTVCRARMYSIFQFSPLREGRHGFCISKGRFATLQFSPLREGRHHAGGCGAWQSISIPAPPRGATGRDSSLLFSLFNFNSRPSARGDQIRRGCGSRRSISIPAPPRGATGAGRIAGPTSKDFNSRPSARGDSTSLYGVIGTRTISIPAPPRGAT